MTGNTLRDLFDVFGKTEKYVDNSVINKVGFFPTRQGAQGGNKIFVLSDFMHKMMKVNFLCYYRVSSYGILPVLLY